MFLNYPWTFKDRKINCALLLKKYVKQYNMRLKTLAHFLMSTGSN